MSDTTRLVKALSEIARINDELITIELQIAKLQEEMTHARERREHLAAKLQSAILSSDRSMPTRAE
jgi:predicted  nucleic acid-binding Zn-ribbon protein